jgi:hypothetical protein
MGQKREGELRSKLGDRMRKHPVVGAWEILRHEDIRSVGIPDMSLTGSGRTTWWEFKHAAPDLKRNEVGSIQHLCMQRLERLGFARYVIWLEDNEMEFALIVRPQHLADFRSKAEVTMAGYDMKGVLDYMKMANERRVIA